jgi:PAS domain S-box-containing protein
VEQLYPLRDADGDIVGIGVICEEITERKRVQSELASANVALRRTLDLLFLSLRAAGVSVFTQDRDLRYIWVGGEYFGRHADSIIGAEEKDVVPPELVEPLHALKQKVFASGQPAQEDLPYLKEGKIVWCNVQIEPWRSRNGEVQSLLGAVSDISERKTTEQHIRTLLGELAHRSRISHLTNWSSSF